MMKTVEFTSACSRALLLACALSIALAGCGKQTNTITTNTSQSAQPSVDVAQLIKQYRALDDSRDSTMKMRAKIEGGSGGPPEVQMNIYRKRMADASKVMLIEFTAPVQERDRDAIVATSPQGEIEATRYIQANDSFASVKGSVNEDSLFGMTLQELVDGQPEKYDFKLVGEETAGSTPVYRVEGNLKSGADSKFSRLVMLLSKENSAAVVSEFYDNHNELMRRLTIDRMEQTGGHWTRMRWTVDNLARQKKIVFETLEAKYDQNLSDAIFSREHLKKLAAK
ncbi:MAG TPA: outer membrane lipoprotein-sorting protein [Blastocatellia bacterium]|nr:outer membrane lipoprotein-sorting protein [Blastocatellia bacterium]